MQQILFHIPLFKDYFPPDGYPVPAFGVMLFITFIACVWLLTRLARRMGAELPGDKTMDLVIACFVGGLIGARLTFMIQYDQPIERFFRIWEGGIVLYGGIITGMLTFLAFYQFILKRAGVPFWKLVDACGPTLALGIALGRIGCFLNGCCWGHAAPEGCPAVNFPLRTAPSAEVVVHKEGYQTPLGFTVKAGPEGVQSIVDRVEPGSAAAAAGLEPGDQIVGVNGRPNGGVLTVMSDQPELLKWATETAQEQGATVTPEPDRPKAIRIVTADPATGAGLRTMLNGRLVFLGQVHTTDAFLDLIHNWPKGDTSLTLEVKRGGQNLTIGPFTPRTIGLHPTQLYETISMLLLVLLLLAFYPFRRHDGQVFSLFLVCYAVHRFLNEALRNDTDIVGIPQLHMTLSQNISVLIVLFAVALEIGHRVWGRPLTAATPQPAPVGTGAGI
jgi:phosphatidylglycerol---prolipoprotein diacylglyceryl transferase